MEAKVCNNASNSPRRTRFCAVSLKLFFKDWTATTHAITQYCKPNPSTAIIGFVVILTGASFLTSLFSAGEVDFTVRGWTYSSPVAIAYTAASLFCSVERRRVHDFRAAGSIVQGFRAGILPTWPPACFSFIYGNRGLAGCVSSRPFRLKRRLPLRTLSVSARPTRKGSDMFCSPGSTTSMGFCDSL